MERVRNEKGVFLSSHGMSHNVPLYKVWCGMKERCSNQHNKSYHRYGGRGIRVCDEWSESFERFYEWSMSNGYKKGLTIDRIDNQKGYSPDNCRWATYSEQNRNYSRNHLITYHGETKCLADWADETGIGMTRIIQRIKLGWDVERLFDKRDGRSLRWQKK